MDENNVYDETIDESKHKSSEKALRIFYQERSMKMEEGLLRPNVDVLKGLTKGLFIIAASSCLCIIITHSAIAMGLASGISICANAAVIGIMAVLFTKKALIWCIQVYQKYASAELRKSCVFQPSCSEYMIASIKSHGTLIGLWKGTKRLMRCHYPNGGIDNP